MTKRRNLDQQKVIDQAIKIIKQDGLKALTLSRLAHDLDIRTQSLYNYIANLDDLLSFVGARYLDELLAKVTKNILGLSGNEALIKFADVVHDDLMNHAPLSDIIFYANGFSKQSEFHQSAMKLVALLNTVINSSHTKDDNPASISGALIGSVLGFVFIEFTGFYENETPESLTKSYHQMILRIITPNKEIETH